MAWALLGWAVAGLAVTARRPRYDIAALALFLSTLARIETLVVLATAAVASLAASVLARRRRDLAPPRAAWTLLAGFLALPVMFVHDWLLTGDPLWFVNVSARYSTSVPDVIATQTPRYMVSWVTGYILGFGILTVLAVLGFLLVVRRRQIALALGLLALGPGVAAFLVFLSIRGTYVSTRYAMPIGLTILFLAGVGFGSLRVPWLVAWMRGLAPRLRRRRSDIRAAIAILTVVTAAVSAAVLVSPFGPRDRATNAAVARSRDQAVDLGRLVPTHQGRARIGPRRAQSGDRLQPAARRCKHTILSVPGLDRPRIAIDLGLPLSRISENPTAPIDLDELVAVPGRVIYHDRRRDTGSGLAALESSSPTISVGDSHARPPCL